MMKRKFGILCLTAVMACVPVMTTGCGMIKKQEINENATILDEDKDGRYEAIEDKLDEIDMMLDRYFLNEDDIDPQAMEDNLLKGYVEGLGEKYTTYYSAEEYKTLMESTSGEYEGIGMVVSQNIETKVITVIQAFEGGPAAGAGMKPGDIIYKVEGEEIGDKDINLVVKDIKGEEGTPVTLTVYRPETEEYIDMTMNRAKIEQPTVTHKMMEDQIGYIGISSFEEITETQFKEAVDELEQQGMKGLVVDLRNNPGGVLTTVCNMLDRILPKDQLLVYTIDKNGQKSEKITSDDDVLEMPIAVIVNGNSASASEIFTAALQDYDKAEIIGETTYGKGIVQVLVPLSDGSAVKMTTSKYYTPKGVCIHEIGVTPDVEVKLELPEGDEEFKDNQLEAAVASVKSQIK